MAVTAGQIGAHIARDRRLMGLSTHELARRTGLSARAITEWERGVNLPSPEHAARVSEVLSSPSISQMVVEARTKVCARCAVPYLQPRNSRKDARFCSTICARREHRKQATDRHYLTTMNELEEVRAELRQYVDLTIANCRECEPEGLCRTPTCIWRSKSPLPLAVA